jgi:hypothetical protein
MIQATPVLVPPRKPVPFLDHNDHQGLPLVSPPACCLPDMGGPLERDTR